MKSSVRPLKNLSPREKAVLVRRQHWTNVDWSKPQVFPPFKLNEGKITNHKCNVCDYEGRRYEILDKFGIVGIVCSQECYALWILKHI